MRQSNSALRPRPASTLATLVAAAISSFTIATLSPIPSSADSVFPSQPSQKRNNFDVSLNSQFRLNGGPFRQKHQLSGEARARLGNTFVSNTLSVVFARYACVELSPDACLEHLSTQDAESQPQYAQVSLEKWDAASQEINEALERLKQTAQSPTAIAVNGKQEVWKMLFNSSILVRLAVGKFEEQVTSNPEVLVPEQIRSLGIRKGLRRLELHHQLVFIGEKAYISHKAVNRTGDDPKAHKLIGQIPLVEVDLRDPNKLGEIVVTNIKLSMVQFGQILGK